MKNIFSTMEESWRNLDRIVARRLSSMRTVHLQQIGMTPLFALHVVPGPNKFQRKRCASANHAASRWNPPMNKYAQLRSKFKQ